MLAKSLVLPPFLGLGLGETGVRHVMFVSHNYAALYGNKK